MILLVRVRPDHWDKVRPAFQLGWAESSRVACLNNLGPMSSVARAVRASADGSIKAADVHRETAERLVEQFHGFRWRHGAVVDIAGDDESIRLRLAHEGDELPEDVRLILGEVDAVKEAT